MKAKRMVITLVVFLLQLFSGKWLFEQGMFGAGVTTLLIYILIDLFLYSKFMKPETKIEVEDVVAQKKVTGLEATSKSMKESGLLNNPLYISVKNSRSLEESVTGMKLDVNEPAEVKEQLHVESDAEIVHIDPKNGKVMFGQHG